VSYTSLGSLRNEIKDGRSRGLTSRSRSGGNSDERVKRLVDRSTFAKRSIDKVQEIGLGVVEVKVHEFSRIHHRTATNR
jgi:hypothetical protein